MGALRNGDCQWASRNSYSNSMRVGCNRMEQIRELVSGDGLEGTSGKRHCHRASSRKLNDTTD